MWWRLSRDSRRKSWNSGQADPGIPAQRTAPLQTPQPRQLHRGRRVLRLSDLASCEPRMEKLWTQNEATSIAEIRSRVFAIER
jgi:hypothetical protein